MPNWQGGGGGRGKDQFTPVWRDKKCNKCGTIRRLPTHPLHPSYQKKCECGGDFERIS